LAQDRVAIRAADANRYQVCIFRRSAVPTGREARRNTSMTKAVIIGGTAILDQVNGVHHAGICAPAVEKLGRSRKDARIVDVAILALAPELVDVLPVTDSTPLVDAVELPPDPSRV